MKKLLFFAFFSFLLLSCHESLEERAAREAKEYTERCCPTPVINNTRTDSVSFVIEDKTYIYYCAFVDQVDDQKVVDQYHDELHQGLYDNIAGNAGMQKFIDAGFRFVYIVHSDKNPQQVLFRDTIVVKK